MITTLEPSYQRDDSSALIDREHVLIKLHGAIKHHALVTVFGPPGVGKSALLEQLSRDQDSTVMVDLTEAKTLRDAILKIADRLNLALEQQDTDFAQTSLSKIARALNAREHVLVLDNTEHLNALLLESLTTLLETTQVCLVLGSRHVLGLEQEHVIKLSPLPTKSAGSAPSPAAALFLKRSPNLHHSSAELKTIEELVTLLDGLPLAIELLASRTKLLKPHELLARQRQEQTRRQSLDPLHQTIALSWNLLNTHERIALRALAFGRGGLPMTCAQELIGAHLDAPAQLIKQLEQHSLIQVVEDKYGPRIKMLLSIRDFAQARVDEDEEALQEAYIEHIANYAYQLYQACQGDIWTEPAPALAQERSNIEHALALIETAPSSHLQNQAKLRLSLNTVARYQNDFELMRALSPAHDQASRQELGESLYIESILASMDATAEQLPPHEAIAKYGKYQEEHKSWPELYQIQYMLRLSLFQGHQHYDEPYLVDLIRRAQALERPREVIEAQIAYAHFAIRQSQLERAVAIAQEAADLALRHHLSYLHARALTFQSYAYGKLERFERSIPLLFQAADYFLKINHVIASIYALYNAAESCLDELRLPEANQALDLIEALSNHHDLGWANGMGRYIRGSVLIEQERYVEAQIELERSAQALERAHRLAFCVAAHLALEQCALLDNEPARAKEAHLDALRHHHALTSSFAKINVRCAQITLALREHRREDAGELMSEVLSLTQNNEILSLRHLCIIHNSKLALYDYKQAILKSKEPERRAALIALIEHLSELPTPSLHHSRHTEPVHSNFILRIGLRLLKRELPEQLSQRLEIMLKDPQREALLIDIKTQSFRPPGELDWVEMANRQLPFKLLLALVEQRCEHPGEPLTPAQLCEAVWPDEIVTAEAASNRLHVTIATIRRYDGMRDLILNEQGNYLLDPQVPIHEA